MIRILILSEMFFLWFCSFIKRCLELISWNWSWNGLWRVMDEVSEMFLLFYDLWIDELVETTNICELFRVWRPLPYPLVKGGSCYGWIFPCLSPGMKDFCWTAWLRNTPLDYFIRVVVSSGWCDGWVLSEMVVPVRVFLGGWWWKGGVKPSVYSKTRA